MIETEIYLINFENKLTDDFEIKLEKYKRRFCFWKRKESVYKVCLEFAKRNL
jgi:hypothetical protein